MPLRREFVAQVCLVGPCQAAGSRRSWSGRLDRVQVPEEVLDARRRRLRPCAPCGCPRPLRCRRRRRQRRHRRRGCPPAGLARAAGVAVTAPADDAADVHWQPSEYRQSAHSRSPCGALLSQLSRKSGQAAWQRVADYCPGVRGEARIQMVLLLADCSVGFSNALYARLLQNSCPAIGLRRRARCTDTLRYKTMR